MSKYAKINKDNVVENIIVCDPSQIGLFEGEYVLISDETRNGAIGYTYDRSKNKFIPTKPFASWVLSENLVWESPIGNMPDDGPYEWDEESLSWNELPVGPFQPSPDHVWDEETKTWSLPE